jgi:hypothetical protein
MSKTKIHRVTVPGSNLQYEGSLTLDDTLMNAAEIFPFEHIYVYNITNGHRFETYVIRGEEDSGTICVNGAAAIQEDVDAIGLSSLAGAHNYLFPSVVELLKEKGVGDIIVFGGGIVPEEDLSALTQPGVKGIFTPGTSIEEAIKWVWGNVNSKRLNLEDTYKCIKQYYRIII